MKENDKDKTADSHKTENNSSSTTSYAPSVKIGNPSDAHLSSNTDLKEATIDDVVDQQVDSFYESTAEEKAEIMQKSYSGADQANQMEDKYTATGFKADVDIKLNSNAGLSYGENVNSKVTYEQHKENDISNTFATSPAINDSASKEDHIGFKPYVQSLARMIRHKETSTPLTIGIYGPWGTGKTSFMMQLENEINHLSIQDVNNKKKIFHVKFDAWKHQTNEKVWAALLQTIPLQLEKDLGLFERLYRRFAHAWSKLDFVAKNTFRFIFWVTIIILTFQCTFYFKSGDWFIDPKFNFFPALGLLVTWKNILPSLGRILSPLGLDLSGLVNKKSLKDHVKSVYEFTGDLKNIIEANIGREGRLILYIDDLDRCSPDNVTGVIEALNVFLDAKQCVFILGMDHEKIAKSIGVKYKDLCGNDDPIEYGNSFLEKIVQLPINLPFMGDDDTKYLSGQLLSLDETLDDQVHAPPIYDNNRPQNEFVDIDFPNVFKSDLKEALIYLKPRSPRNIKRFINKAWFYFLLSKVDNETFKDVDPTYLGLWLLLHELYPYEIESMKGTDVTWENILERPIGKLYDFPDIRAFVLKIDEKNTDKDDKYWLLKYYNKVKISPYLKLTDSVDIGSKPKKIDLSGT